ncbi:MAG TPA: hypothetical protein VGN24_04855 [Rhodanobacter sp.]|jgi:hypothetical protein|nr:hypothetical protein [Rhodanobacter sp.]
MHYLIALIYFVLALTGLDGFGSHTLVTRASSNGADVLYSRTTTIADAADIACVRSASGSCHYRLLARDCIASRLRAVAGSCTADPPRQFVLATGTSKAIVGLPAAFTLCVGQGSDVGYATCETWPAMNASGLY